MHVLDFESVAKSSLSQQDGHVPKGWTGSELKLQPIFLNNVPVLEAPLRSSIWDVKHQSMMRRGLCNFIL